VRWFREELSKKKEKNLLGPESVVEPGPSDRPFLPGLVGGSTQSHGDLLMLQTDEVTKFGHARRDLVLGG
jgi:hypothetical protein